MAQMKSKRGLMKPCNLFLVIFLIDWVVQRVWMGKKKPSLLKLSVKYEALYENIPNEGGEDIFCVDCCWKLKFKGMEVRVFLLFFF